jgi:septum formation protein
MLIKRWLGERPLTLASGSPRRRDILEAAGLEFEIVLPLLDESATIDLPPKRFAISQAICKLQSVEVKSGVVVAADTIVVLEDAVLGKPIDRADARRILGLLSDQTHTVYTALALRHVESGKVVADLEASRVIFKKLTEQQIEDYIDSGEPMDKAGAYGIQGMGEFLVDRLDGRLNNVIGFPPELFAKLLRELNGGV